MQYFKLRRICARDAKGLVLFAISGKKTEATAEPGAARPGAKKNEQVQKQIEIVQERKTIRPNTSLA